MAGTVAVAGAGFSGAVVARELALAGYQVEVFEARAHLAGNCHTRRDAQTGVLVHHYGPHIFHTSNARVWEYVQQFDTFMPFTNRVKAISAGAVYSLPINLHTINAFYRRTLSPAEAAQHIRAVADHAIGEPQNFEEQALKFIGRDLYEAFFKGYTAKQWGVDPRQLPASILRRLPVRFNYDDNYYASTYQGMPRNGYTHIVEKMLDHPGIRVHLGTRFEPAQAPAFHHVFYSGPLDQWFGGTLGELGYRTLDFVEERHAGDFQGNAVINYCDADVPWTRISEHKHFAPWEEHADTVIYREYSRACGAGDTPYYPIRLLQDKAALARYVAQAHAAAPNVSFMGRLGTYRYLDMHVTIAEALDLASAFLAAEREGRAAPRFSVDPLAG